MAIFGNFFDGEQQQQPNGEIFGNVFGDEFEEQKQKHYQRVQRKEKLQRLSVEQEMLQREADRPLYRFARQIPTGEMLGKKGFWKGVGMGMKKGAGMLVEGERKLGRWMGEALAGEDIVKAIESNNKSILGWRQLMKESPERQENSAKMIRELMERNAELAEQAGGDVKNITNRQIAGVAAEVAIDFATAGGEVVLAKAFKGTKAIKTISPLLVGTGLGSVYGITGELQQKEAPTKEQLAKSAAIGGALGLGLSLASRGAGKLFRKIFHKPKTKEAAKIAKATTPQKGVPPKGVDLADWFRVKDDVSVNVQKRLGKDLEGNEIISRLEWDYKGGKGELLVTQKVKKENLAHEAGHYLAKTEEGIEKKFLDEVTAITGGNKNINEDFADAVRDVILKPEVSAKAPGLTKFIQEQGIKVKSPKVVVKETPAIKKIAKEVKEAPVKKVAEEVKPKEIPAKKPEKLESLAKEAKKFKSAEEFVGVQKPLYHRTKEKFDRFDLKKQKTGTEKGMHFYHDKSDAMTLESEIRFGKKLKKVYVKGKIARLTLNPQPDVVPFVGKRGEELRKGLMKRGYIGHQSFDETVIYRPEKDIYTKQQLTDIYKQAVKEAKPIVKPPAKSAVEIVQKVKKAPTVVQQEVKKTHKAGLDKGLSEPQAKAEAVKKVIVYEKKVDKLASKNAVINSLIRERRGTTPRKRVETTGINWSKVNTSEGTEKILDKVFHDNKQFKGARPSRTNKDIVEGARMVNIDPNDKVGLDNLLKTMPNANTAHKLKQMMVDSAADLKNYIDTIGDFGLASRGQLKTLKAKFMRTQSISKAFSGMRTESSHLLRSMGIEVVEGENDILAELGKGLQRASRESGKEMNIDTLSKFMSKGNKMVEATLADKALAIWYNSILSGWKTWTRNIMDTGLSLFAETISKVANPAAWKEAPEFVAGLIKNLRYSIPDAYAVLKGKRVVQKYTTRGATSQNIFKNKWVNTFFELSGRVLDAQDVVYSGSIKRVDNGTTKFLKKYGISGGTAEELNKAIKEQFAERVTYRNKPLGPIGKVSGSLGELTNKVKVLKLFAPFTKVVANVLDRKVDYMPFLNLMRTFNTTLTKNQRGGYRGYLAQEAEVILRKTEIPRHKWDDLMPVLVKRLKHQQLGRLYLGTMVTIGAQGLAQKGLISGDGPSNLNQKRQLQAAGWRPFSIKVGGYWIPYKYFGPLSGILAANGSIADEMKYNKRDTRTWEKIVDGLHGFAGATLDQSFMSGISGFFELMTGKINKDRWARNFFTGIIPYPALLQQTQSAIDGKSYDVQTMTEAIAYKFGFYKNLTPRLTALGEEIRSDLIYGITPSEIQDNLQSEFEKRGVKVSLPAKTTKLGDNSMTREQLWEYTKLRGEKIKRNSDKIFKAMDKEETQELKEKEFQSWIDKAGEEVKTDMKEKYDIKTEKKRRKPKKRVLK